MPHAQTRKRIWIATPLLLCWLAGTSYAFWWFQARDLRAFDSKPQDMAVFKGQGLMDKLLTLPVGLQQGEPTQALVVHFWNPACGCNKFNNPHVRDIVQQYRGQGIRFLTVVQSQAGEDMQALSAEARELFDTPVMLDTSLQLDPASLPAATPAAAVINTKGQLAYFGPYSDSAFCGVNGSAFVEKTLDKILAGNATESLNTLAYGCFCQWKSGTNKQSI